MQPIKRTKFKRSVDEHISYYSKKTAQEKLSDTLMLSDLCIKLQKNGGKVKFSGK